MKRRVELPASGATMLRFLLNLFLPGGFLFISVLAALSWLEPGVEPELLAGRLVALLMALPFVAIFSWRIIPLPWAPQEHRLRRQGAIALAAAQLLWLATLLLLLPLAHLPILLTLVAGYLLLSPFYSQRPLLVAPPLWIVVALHAQLYFTQLELNYVVVGAVAVASILSTLLQPGRYAMPILIAVIYSGLIFLLLPAEVSLTALFTALILLFMPGRGHRSLGYWLGYGVILIGVAFGGHWLLVGWTTPPPLLSISIAFVVAEALSPLFERQRKLLFTGRVY